MADRDPKEEAKKLERSETHPVSYAWSHPINQEDSELFQWFMSLSRHDQKKLFSAWQRGEI